MAAKYFMTSNFNGGIDRKYLYTEYSYICLTENSYSSDSDLPTKVGNLIYPRLDG